MTKVYLLLVLTVIFGVLTHQIGGCCHDDCPKDEKCECDHSHSGECKDKSEHCAKFKPHCENFFFRKCIKCACPLTCGVCKPPKSSSSSSEETPPTTTTTTTTTTTSTTTTEEPTTESTTEPTTTESTTEEPTTTTLITTTEEWTTLMEEVMMAVETTTLPEPTGSTVDEFKDDNRVKCKPCEARRKALADLYDKYYPQPGKPGAGADVPSSKENSDATTKSNVGSGSNASGEGGDSDNQGVKSGDDNGNTDDGGANGRK